MTSIFYDIYYAMIIIYNMNEFYISLNWQQKVACVWNVMNTHLCMCAVKRKVRSPSVQSKKRIDWKGGTFNV